MDRFGLIIDELADEMEEDLIADGNGICAIMVEEKIPLQIELDESGERLLVCTSVSEVVAGKFRETLLKECLKHNALMSPRYGTFAFLEPTNELVMFEFLPVKEMTGQKLYQYLNLFIPKALEWRAAIDSGSRLPTGVEDHSQERPKGMGL